MPRTPLQFQNMKDERKLSILECSLPLFSLYGNKVSIDLICSKAKCSHGLIYHYYKNTKDIFDDLLKSDTYNCLASKLIIDDKNKKAEEQIREIISVLYSLKTIEEMSYANIIISNEEKGGFVQNFIKLVKRGQKEEEITNGSPDSIAYCIILLFKGIYLSYLTNKKANIKKPDIENIYEIFRKIYF
ncbi:MAG TPA: hypothetical protein DDW20_04050 [Firmicutes bacterium]|nr:hypothetical protein [Bacillota bacterium]